MQFNVSAYFLFLLISSSSTHWLYTRQSLRRLAQGVCHWGWCRDPGPLWKDDASLWSLAHGRGSRGQSVSVSVLGVHTSLQPKVFGNITVTKQLRVVYLPSSGWCSVNLSSLWTWLRISWNCPAELKMKTKYLPIKVMAFYALYFLPFYFFRLRPCGFPRAKLPCCCSVAQINLPQVTFVQCDCASTQLCAHDVLNVTQ